MQNNADETIHLQEENLNNHIPILDSVVNRFKAEIILSNNKVKQVEVKHNNRKVYINSEDLENNLSDILRRHIKPGKIAIFTELNDSENNKLQQKIIELFDNVPNITFVRCSYHAKDMNNEDGTYRQIQKYHKYETGHKGINENYEGLKKHIY